MASSSPTSSSQTSDQPTSRLTSLQARQQDLTSKLSALQTERAQLVSTTTLPSGLAMRSDWSDEARTKAGLEAANVLIKEHIKALHRYNEIKDVGLGLMGMIADKRGVRVSDVMVDFGVGEAD